MTVEELKKGEYEKIEFKQDIPADKEKYLKTAVAFANGSGGKIIFGIENNTWNVLGFSDDEVFRKYDLIANSIFDSCEPVIVPVMTIEEINDRKIIVAEIRSGMAKPFYLRRYGMMEGTYVRVAGVTRKAEDYMIKELQLEGSSRGFDGMQVAGEITEDEIKVLCERMYRSALERCKSDEQRTSQKKVTVSQLVSWKIVIHLNGKYYPTYAWKLLNGEADEVLPDAFIQLAAFKGNSRSVFLDKNEAKGPLDMQIEEAMQFVKKHINLGSRIEGIYREDFYELPLDSVREMIANAVCHRSYLSPGTIQVAVYDDRLEVTSPGRLSSGLTIEQIIAGNSRIQNTAISAAFFYMHIIERWGSGIPRVFEDARLYGLGEPEIKDFGTSFRISIRRNAFKTDSFGVIAPASSEKVQPHISVSNDAELKSSASNDAELKSSASNDAELFGNVLSLLTEKSRDKALMILMEMKKDPHITGAQIGKNINISRATVQRIIGELKEIGVVSRQGSNNGGVWVIS